MFWFIVVQLVIYGLLTVALVAFTWHCLDTNPDDADTADDHAVKFVFLPIAVCLLLGCIGILFWGLCLCL